MIIRVRFVEAGVNGNEIHQWCLFSVPDTNTLLETFHGIYSGQITCGRTLDFDLYESDGFLCSVASSKKVRPQKSDMMPAPSPMELNGLKETGISLFIQFDLQRKKVVNVTRDVEPGEPHAPQNIGADVATGSRDDHENEDEVDSVTNFLINRRGFYVQAKKESTHRDIKQFNAALAKEKKWAVRAPELDDFTECVQLFSELLWEVDPHFAKNQIACSSVPRNR